MFSIILASLRIHLFAATACVSWNTVRFFFSLSFLVQKSLGEDTRSFHKTEKDAGFEPKSYE